MLAFQKEVGGSPGRGAHHAAEHAAFDRNLSREGIPANAIKAVLTDLMQPAWLEAHPPIFVDSYDGLPEAIKLIEIKHQAIAANIAVVAYVVIAIASKWSPAAAGLRDRINTSLRSYEIA